MSENELDDLDARDVRNERERTTRSDSQRLDEVLRQKLEGLIPEVVRRTFYAGLGAVFTTEEGIRRLANEFSLPKDVATYLIQQAQATKDELFRLLAAELRTFLENLNLNEELQRLLTSLRFEIKTEIRFLPSDARPMKPRVKNRVTVRRRSAREADEARPTEDEVDPREPGD